MGGTGRIENTIFGGKMKRLLLGLSGLLIAGALFFLPSDKTCYAVSPYYNLQQYRIVPDTTNIRNDMYFRGDIKLTDDASTANLVSCSSDVVIFASGTIKAIDFKGSGTSLTGILTPASTTYFPSSGTGYFKGDGTNKDFSIDSTSATFYDGLYVNGTIFAQNNVTMLDNKSLRVGNDLDFNLGYKSSTNEFRLTRGDDISILSNNIYKVGTSSMTISTMTAINCNSTNKDFSIDATSATFYDPVYMPYPPFTMAELKLSTPTVAGMPFYDSTNKSAIISTGTTNCASYGLINNGSTKPTGW